MTLPDHIITVNLNTAIDRVLEVPNLGIGSHAKGRQLSRFPAGKAINVSRALARVRCDSIATGFVGQSESSHFEKYLKDTGPGRIICQLLSVRGQTRENITLIDPVSHTDTHIRDEGFEITDADFHRMMSKLGLLARSTAIMVFSGSLPRGMDVQKFNMLLMIAMSGGAKVVLDTGGDMLAQLLPPPEAPPLEDSEEGSKDISGGDSGEDSGGDSGGGGSGGENPLWLIKPNLQELGQLIGNESLHETETDQILQAGRSLARRVTHVVVTNAAHGAWLFHGKHAWHGHVEIDQNDVVNTVGCGDAMVAGILDSQICSRRTASDSGIVGDMEETDMPIALKRGLAVATANALWPGIAEFDLQQVQAIEKQVTVSRIK